jgi:4-hydroxy-tetrahydrodipicolinate synthase
VLGVLRKSLDGCITAIMTPFKSDGELDAEGLGQLLEFQLANGVDGIVVAGTTGEGPTLEHREFVKALSLVLDGVQGKALTIANTGANSTRKAVEATVKAWELGARAALLVDPYYNCPSSLEIRREYYEPIARVANEMRLIPYVIPGRTGTQISPEDLALLARAYPNVNAVKEATGSSDNAAEIRSLCGDSFSILSGDDERTFSLMTDPRVSADGTISVMSNIAPKAVADMVAAALKGDLGKAVTLTTALKPLFELVTVRTDEAVLGHTLTVKAKNPLPVKTMAAVLGMPAGRCRQPLGRMTKTGLNRVLTGLESLWKHNPEVLEPVEKGFGVSVADRLGSPASLEGLCYESY